MDLWAEIIAMTANWADRKKLKIVLLILKKIKFLFFKFFIIFFFNKKYITIYKKVHSTCSLSFSQSGSIYYFYCKANSNVKAARQSNLCLPNRLHACRRRLIEVSTFQPRILRIYVISLRNCSPWLDKRALSA